MSKLLLVDGNSLTYRAFFALPQDMSTASGQLTNAVFGFTSMFINVLKEQRPDEVLVAFDRPEPTFRHEADATYKANRDAAPDPLRQQMGLVREVLQALGVATCELAGWEADDIIATATEQAVGRGDDVLIVTGDRDAYQLVAGPARQGPLQPARRQRLRALRRGRHRRAHRRDAGAVPGVRGACAATRATTCPASPGVGEKTAAKLIQTYGGLDGIFAHVDEQTPKLRASLAEHEERVRKNHEIMILRRDAPIELPDSLVMQPNMVEVQKLFDFLEFRTFAERLADALGPAAVVLSSDEREQLVAEITVSESPAASAATLASLAAVDLAPSWEGEAGPHAARRARRRHRRRRGRRHVDPGRAPRRRRPSPPPSAPADVRAHDAKALMRWLLAHEPAIDLAGLALDTAIAAYLLDPAEARYELRHLVERYTRFALAPDEPAAKGQLDLDGTQADPADGRRARGARRPPARRADHDPARRAGHGRPLRDDREPARARARPHGARRHRRRRRRPARAATPA